MLRAKPQAARWRRQTRAACSRRHEADQGHSARAALFAQFLTRRTDTAGAAHAMRRGRAGGSTHMWARPERPARPRVTGHAPQPEDCGARATAVPSDGTGEGHDAPVWRGTSLPRQCGRRRPRSSWCRAAGDGPPRRSRRPAADDGWPRCSRCSCCRLHHGPDDDDGVRRVSRGIWRGNAPAREVVHRGRENAAVEL
jgi:hypothetical protein